MPRIDLGSGPDFGKALRIALCQRGVQNQLRGPHTFVVLSAGMPNSIPSMVLGLGITVGGNGHWEWPVRPSLEACFSTTSYR